MRCANMNFCRRDDVYTHLRTNSLLLLDVSGFLKVADNLVGGSSDLGHQSLAIELR